MSRFHCISADSHVVEPANVWTDYIEAAYRDRAPRVVKENGNDVFKCEGVELLGVAGGSAAGRAQTRSMHGTYEKDVHRGAYDPDARLRDMASDGVEADVIYPTIALTMYALPDAPFQAACFRAYNRWMADFCAAHRDRLKGIALATLDSLDWAVEELRRAKKQGLAGVAVAVYRDEEDEAGYASRAFDPFWAVAEELELPVSLHIVTDKKARTFNDLLHARSPLAGAASRATEPMWVQKTLTVMILGGLFQRFPRLRVISAENDAGWAGYFIERLDYIFDRRRSVAGFPIASGALLPSDYFRRNVRCTFMRDHSSMAVRHLVGVNNLMWSNDYPHTDSTWPNSQQVIGSLFKNVPEDEKHRIIAANAAELYGFE